MVTITVEEVRVGADGEAVRVETEVMAPAPGRGDRYHETVGLAPIAGAADEDSEASDDDERPADFARVVALTTIPEDEDAPMSGGEGGEVFTSGDLSPMTVTRVRRGSSGQDLGTCARGQPVCSRAPSGP